uniref:VWFD domain-containing protein n=1 Tax=Plectus sambesii TaxID=2011161 RepID=A0A914WS98_9BILA
MRLSVIVALLAMATIAMGATSMNSMSNNDRKDDDDNKKTASASGLSSLLGNMFKKTSRDARSKSKSCTQDDGIAHAAGSTWIYKGFQWTCKTITQTKQKSTRRNRVSSKATTYTDYRAVKTGCVLDDKSVVASGQKKTVGGSTYECQSNDGDLKLVTIVGNVRTTREVRPATDNQQLQDCRLAKCTQKDPTTAPYCFASGDPHTTSFDGYRHDYQGTCRYVLTQPKSKTYANPFRVIQKTEHRSSTTKNMYNQQVSYVKYLEVEVYGQVLRLGKGGYLTVNGVNRTAPFFYPDMPDNVCDLPTFGCKISVQKSGSKGLLLNANFGLAVFYDGDQVMKVSIPADAALKGGVQGMCGNNDGTKPNDCAYPNGTVSNNYSVCGDSWIIPDTEDPKCTRGADIPLAPACDATAKAGYEARCKLLTDTTGPFAACLKDKALAQSASEAYENCVFDACAFKGSEDIFCDAYSSLAQHCQAMLSDIDDDGVTTGVIVSWRTPSRCPRTCPTGMTFTNCGPACTPTCNNPEPECDQPCVEDCVCPEGQVLDKVGGVCIALAKCGCVDEDNNYRAIGEKWTRVNCDGDCTCSANGQIDCIAKQCLAPFVCGATNGNRACTCAVGYEMKGTTCADIDECSKFAGLCGPGAVCQNNPGSYVCNCANGYSKQGDACVQIATTTTSAPTTTTTTTTPSTTTTTPATTTTTTKATTTTTVTCPPPPTSSAGFTYVKEKSR